MIQSRNILIAAGGTGGHIYPALAIANQLKALDPSLNITFVGTAHGLENRLVPAAHYPLKHLNVGRLNSNVSLKERLKTLCLLPWAFVQSLILLKNQKPVLVLGVGGHASGPLLLIASLFNYKTVIWEPNAMPGLANRLLSRFVDEAWVVFEEAKKFLKTRNIKSCGFPIRTEIESLPPRKSSREKFHLLVFGGSQGARGINRCTAEMIVNHSECLNEFSVLHQTGAADYKEICEKYGEALKNPQLEVREYLYDMDQQYANADLVVSRSGTGTLSELAACGKAAILIPFPFASDQHQQKNAESLVHKDAAIMILQKDLNPQLLLSTIRGLLADEAKRKRLETNIKHLHKHQAALELAKTLLQSIEKPLQDKQETDQT